MPYPIAPALGAYTGQSGVYIPEIWSGKLLEKFYISTVLAAISNTDYEGEIKAYGDTVNIRTIPDMIIRDYQIGTGLVYDRPQGTKVSLYINKGKYFGVSINDVEKKQSDIAYVNKWAEDASEQMKITIDAAVLADIFADASAYNKGATAGKISADINLGATGSSGSNAVVLNKANIIDYIVMCGQILDEQNVPENSRWFILPAWAVTRIKTSEIKDASMTGDGKSVLRNGRIGMIDRFEIFSSNNLYITTETSTKCWNSVFGHKSALTFATQLTENETIANPNDFGKLMRGLQVYGYKVLHTESLGHLYCRPGTMA